MVRRKAVGTDMRERAAACYVGCVSSVFLLYTGASGYVAITAAKWHLFELFSAAYVLFSLYLRAAATHTGKARAVSARPSAPAAQ